MEDKKKENLHAGHRAKVRARFLSEGLESFEDHQILELILFYSVPRVDTNETAHRLVRRFGSLRGVLDADYRELLTVEGVGENSAALIRTYAGVAKKYYSSPLPQKKMLPSYDEFGNRLVVKFSGCKEERVYAVFLDNAYAVCGEGIMHEGDINSVSFSTRKLAENALSCGASYIILAHNHPMGVPIASSDDLNTTGVLRSIIAHLNLILVDHFIVAENKFSSIDKRNYEELLGRMAKIRRMQSRKQK